MKKSNLLRVLLASILLLSFPSLGQGSGDRISGNLDFFSSPAPDAHQPVISAINSAKSSIKMKMFHLSDPNVADALIAAAKRNVDVKLILDKIQWNNPKDVTLNDTMIQAGIKLVKASDGANGFSLTHEKSMIIDENKAMVSTMNQVKNFAVTLDFGVFTTDAGVISEMLSVYEADWQNAAANTSNTPALSNPFLVWSPVNSSQKLVDLIGSTQNKLDLFVENLSATDVINALTALAAQHKVVRVIVPYCNASKANFNLPAITTLRAAGVDAKMFPGPATADIPYVHAKAIVVDQQKVFLGSENFSFNSLTKAREVGMIIPDDKISTDVSTQFENYWPKAVLPPTDPNYTCSAWVMTEPTKSGLFLLPRAFDLSK